MRLQESVEGMTLLEHSREGQEDQLVDLSWDGSHCNLNTQTKYMFNKTNTKKEHKLKGYIIVLTYVNNKGSHTCI